LVSKSVIGSPPEGEEAQNVVSQCVKCCVSYRSLAFAEQG